MPDPLVTIWKQREVIADTRLYLAHIAVDSKLSDEDKDRARELLTRLSVLAGSHGVLLGDRYGKDH